MTWQLAILTDGAGHVHVGAVVSDGEGDASRYVDLLAPVGARPPSELDLEGLAVLVRSEDLTALRRLAERCIDDVRLRNRLVELTYMATAVQQPTISAA